MAPEGAERCSTAARANGEQLAGSAPHARKWLLLEHPGPWAKKALETPPFAGGLGARMEAAAAERGAKILLIRRPGRQPAADQPRQWFVVDTVTGLSSAGQWRTEHDLTASAFQGVASAGGAMGNDAAPMILVCTHGVRDACCAIRGRPVMGSLARTFGDQVWECTHLGGHRFAATLLHLPDGACYGMLDQADVVGLIKRHRSGDPDPRFLRGYTRDAPAGQAALVQAMQDNPHLAPQLEVSSVVTHHEGQATVEVTGALPGGEGSWYDVVTHELPRQPLSCGKAPGDRMGFRVTARERP